MTTLIINFPREKLTPFPPDQPPNAAMVNMLKRELFANAAAIPCPAGGGNHGHLGLVMPVADYAALGGGVVPWVDPADPGVLAPAAGVAAVIAAATAQWNNDKFVYNTFVGVRNKLKQQVLEAVPDCYLNALADPMIGYANVTVTQMILSPHQQLRSHHRRRPC